MKSYIILSILVVLAVDVARALECYHCGFHEGEDLEGRPRETEDYLDESCKNHKKPNKKFVKECDSESDVCVKVFISAERKGKHIRSTLRHCDTRQKYPEFELNSCEFKKGQEFEDLIGIKVPENSKGTLCVCTGDKCNSSSRLKITNGLNFVTIGILVYKLFPV